MKKNNFESDLPKNCQRCPRGAFNDYWCVWAESQCYKDALKKDNKSVASQAKA